MTTQSSKGIDDLLAFLKTLKIHHKDMDICFNDAVAGAHLMQLIDSYTSTQINATLDQILAQGHGGGNWRRLVISHKR